MTGQSAACHPRSAPFPPPASKFGHLLGKVKHVALGPWTRENRTAGAAQLRPTARPAASVDEALQMSFFSSEQRFVVTRPSTTIFPWARTATGRTCRTDPRRTPGRNRPRPVRRNSRRPRIVTALRHPGRPEVAPARRVVIVATPPPVRDGRVDLARCSGSCWWFRVVAPVGQHGPLPGIVRVGQVV